MAFSLASARKAATQQAHRKTNGQKRHNSLYAIHRQAIITLHFLDGWTGLAIAKQMQEDEPELKKITLAAVTTAVCRALRAERKRRATAPP